MYLAADAVRRTFDFVGSHAAGSGIVFDFVSQAMIEMIARVDMNQVPDSARGFIQSFLDLTRDEPWIFGLPFREEREYLEESGLHLHDQLQIRGEEAAKRYLTRSDGTEVAGQVVAETMARFAAQAPTSPEAAARMREQQRAMAHQLAVAVVGNA